MTALRRASIQTMVLAALSWGTVASAKETTPIYMVHMGKSELGGYSYQETLAPSQIPLGVVCVARRDEAVVRAVLPGATIEHLGREHQKPSLLLSQLQQRLQNGSCDYAAFAQHKGEGRAAGELLRQYLQQTTDLGSGDQPVKVSSLATAGGDGPEYYLMIPTQLANQHKISSLTGVTGGMPCFATADPISDLGRLTELSQAANPGANVRFRSDMAKLGALSVPRIQEHIQKYKRCNLSVISPAIYEDAVKSGATGAFTFIGVGG